jgi:predicted ATPase
VVITGGPGAGKTTLLDALRARGYATTGDAARALVREDPRVRDDPAEFQDRILARVVAAYEAARAAGGTVFFDRGIPDVAAGFAHSGLPVPGHVDAAARTFTYARTVFVAPPWAEIYVTDAERTHTYDHAVAVHAAVVATYARYGYDLVELPCASVAERVAFVESRTAGPPEGSPAA